MSHAFFDTIAELGSEEDDEDFQDDEDAPRQKKTNGVNGNMEDSSEEEEDEDEEAEREVREGFIVDEDEEEVIDEAERRERRRKRKEREREEEVLDEEDLDLIGEATGIAPRKPTQSKYKRLKRGHKGDRSPREARGVDEIFSDDDEEADDRRREPRGGLVDEFADFIEEDEFEDDIQRDLEDEREVARPGLSNIAHGLQAAGLDEGAEEDYRAAFGDGTEYDWAIELQEEQDQQLKGEGRDLELKDVFEPSQLVEKMLTDEDNRVREEDVPERLQLARKAFKPLELTPEEMDTRLDAESVWITQLLWPKKDLPRYFADPFQKAVRKVLYFLNVEDYEVPFIFTHRKDYLIHAPGDGDFDPDDLDAPPRDAAPERLLEGKELWEILDLDLRYRALTEKRDALQRNYENLKSISSDVSDPVFEEILPKATTIEEVQELQDYLNFQYSAQMKDLHVMESEATGVQKRAQTSRNLFEKIRAGNVYNMVRAFGITAENFAQNVQNTDRGRRHFTEDPSERPDDMADSLVDPPAYHTGTQVLQAAKAMYVEELVMSPQLRRHLRIRFYQGGLVDCVRTDKGLRKITEDHPYYEFKYLRSQDFHALSRKPDMYLSMLKAEEEGLIHVKVRIDGYERFKQDLYRKIESDGQSEIADAWNALRREVLDAALVKLENVLAKGVKETLKTECEKALLTQAREAYYSKLDQAPYKPKGEALGSRPAVIALSNGKGQRGDAICWAFVDRDGRMFESGKFVDFRMGNKDRNIPHGQDIEAFCEVVRRRKPDVIGVSGFAVETRKLYKDLQNIVDEFDLRGNDFDDPDDEDAQEGADKLDIVIVNDEVARLYQHSDRAQKEYPTIPPLTRYCVALARYLQSPVQEYAAVGRDIVSIPFIPNQNLLPQDKLFERLETAMVDVVNLIGVDLGFVLEDRATQNLLPYVCGLGPRKADAVIKAIQANGEEIRTRAELIGYSTSRGELKPAVGPKVFQNCASFVYIQYDSQDDDLDYLDNTRVHPEDYDLARKMAADAMELDEEDVKAETEEGGSSAIIRRMVREDQNEKVNDLILEEYASEIERTLGMRKRATLETIRAELVIPYEEIRRSFCMMSTDEIFTMLTGETKDSLVEQMIVPVQIRRTFPDHIEVRLDCGVEGGISESEYPEGVGHGGMEPRQVFQTHQTVRAKLMYLNKKNFSAQLSLREDVLRRPYQKVYNHLPSEWDERQEAEDKKAAEKEKETVTGRAHRVVNHPLFFAYNAAQAEEYLGTKEAGEVVIRPSSKGLDHLAVTWKIADGVFQHLDVLELDKENEYSLGKTLKVGRATYTDLDELIVNHVEAMSKKVTEMMKDERYQKGSKAQAEQWLKTYIEANPKRSMYAFCINPKYAGYFYLCFKAGINSEIGAWPVKVIPNAFELQHHQYPDMKALKNGFKLLFQNTGGQPRAPPGAIPRR